MCGIVGYVGLREPSGVLLEGLARLEYRGYDSAGIALQNGKGLEFRKVAGKPIWDEWVAEASKTVPEAQELLDLLLKTAADARKKHPTTRTYGK